MGLLIAYGSYQIAQKDPYSGSVKATALAGTDCKPYTADDGTRFYRCTVIANYTVDKIYSISKVINSSNPIKPGELLTVSYNPTNPSDFVLREISDRNLGIIIIAMAVSVLVIVWISVYMVNRNRQLAINTGFQSVWNNVI